MSKGPGKWQQMILSELVTKEAFYLRGLLGRHCTKAQYNALLRAAQTLESEGKINITRFRFGAAWCIGKTVVHRILTTFTGNDRMKMDQF